MRKFIVALLFLLASIVLNSQNLVPNWSFETYTLCPNSPNYAPSPWTMPTSNSADYYNACAPISSSFNVPYVGLGFQPAKNGVAVEGIWCTQMNGTGSMTNYREYIQVKLIDSLLNTNCYYVEFYTNLDNYSRYGINNIAANFSNIQYTTSGSGFGALNVPMHITNYGNPIIKDTLNWVQISGIYVAGGGGKYITLGNFKDDINTDTTSALTNYPGSYFYFDAVSVFSINPTGALPWTYNDTSVSIGDSVYIGNTMGGTFTSSWYTLPGVFIKNGPGIYVKPTVTSQYVVQFTVCGVPRSDTLTVTVTGVGINELGFMNDELRIVPNPNNGVFNLEILNSKFVIENSEIKIVNLLGLEIKKEKLKDKKQQINLPELSSGVYYLQLWQNNKILVVNKIIKQ